jgi:CheY-like chemotaxis protein
MSAELQEQKPRILVVDDDGDARVIMRVMLDSSPRPYYVEEACAGSEAMKMVERFRPDVILLDVMLPDDDGMAILRNLKHDRITRNTRVILVTAHTGDRILRAGMACGADDYLSKPVSHDRLIGVVERLLASATS